MKGVELTGLPEASLNVRKPIVPGDDKYKYNRSQHIQLNDSVFIIQ